MAIEINEAIDMAQKIKELLRPYESESKNDNSEHQNVMSAKKEDEKELLRLCVNELNELYESIEQSMEQVRTKGLALLAGDVKDELTYWGGLASRRGGMVKVGKCLDFIRDNYLLPRLADVDIQSEHFS